MLAFIKAGNAALSEDKVMMETLRKEKAIHTTTAKPFSMPPICFILLDYYPNTNSPIQYLL
ncbi:hypothetical protein [Segetibacter koreensis]|uniref:hypothetical protein n=1 Tax=Segetibacter koreensis TaxID=398037 RepID=UPI00035D00B2|nr:hypothetical protein [Segetibacter koreensis]